MVHEVSLLVFEKTEEVLHVGAAVDVEGDRAGVDHTWWGTKDGTKLEM